MNEPGIVKDNPLTRMMDAAKQENQNRGALAGRMSGTPVVPIGTRVQSGAMQSPRFLPPEEQAELDKKLLEITVDAPRSEDGYTSFEDAANAGAPVNRPDVTPMTASEYVRAHPSATQDILRSAYGSSVESEAPARLINFKRVQGIDLIRGVAWVDNFEIKIDPQDVRDMKKYVMDIAVAYVTQQLAEAVAELVEDDIVSVVEQVKSEATQDVLPSPSPTQEDSDGVQG